MHCIQCEHTLLIGTKFKANIGWGERLNLKALKII